MYAITLAMTMVAIAAFGFFIYRDYQDQGQVHAALSGGPVTTAPGAAVDQGNAPVATPGAGGAPAAAAPAGGTTVSNSGGSSVSGGGGAASSGSSSSGGSTAPVSVAGGNTQACQGGAINIGQIVPITGPVTEQTAANAVAAYFKQVNASGGINGCSVNFT